MQAARASLESELAEMMDDWESTKVERDATVADLTAQLTAAQSDLALKRENLCASTERVATLEGERDSLQVRGRKRKFLGSGSS